MTAREQHERSLPELFVIVASAEDATALAPLGERDPEVRPVLVATGPDPMAVDEVLDDLGALAGRVLLVETPDAGPAGEVAAMLPRLDGLVADDTVNTMPEATMRAFAAGETQVLVATSHRSPSRTRLTIWPISTSTVAGSSPSAAAAALSRLMYPW